MCADTHLQSEKFIDHYMQHAGCMLGVLYTCNASLIDHVDINFNIKRWQDPIDFRVIFMPKYPADSKTNQNIHEFRCIDARTDHYDARMSTKCGIITMHAQIICDGCLVMDSFASRPPKFERVIVSIATYH